MRKIEVERLFCDCCGKEVENRFYSSFKIPKLYGYDEYEMCKECYEKFIKFLKEFVKVKRDEEAEGK